MRLSTTKMNVFLMWFNQSCLNSQMKESILLYYEIYYRGQKSYTIFGWLNILPIAS